MRKVYTALEISDSNIKLLILEKINNDFFPIYKDKIDTNGLKDGKILIESEVANSLSILLDNCFKRTGIKIDKTILIVPTVNASFMAVGDSIEIDNLTTSISSYDLSKLYSKLRKDNITYNTEMVMLKPITYYVDGLPVINPIGKEGLNLETRSVLGFMPKNVLYPYFTLLHNLHIDVLGVIYNLVGDYELIKTPETNSSLSVMINMGDDLTYIGIFNKGVLINSSTLNLGINFILKDIASTYNISLANAKFLKDNYISLSSKSSGDYDTINLDTLENINIKIKSEEVSKMFGSRLVSVLRSIGSEIKKLTSKNVDYLLFSGGLTEIKGSKELLETVFNNIVINDVKMIGVRDNSFSSIIGGIIYFVNEEKANGRDISILSEEEIEVIMDKEFSL